MNNMINAVYDGQLIKNAIYDAAKAAVMQHLIENYLKLKIHGEIFNSLLTNLINHDTMFM